MLAHHKLKVYQQALAQAASADGLSALWGRRHAIVDLYPQKALPAGVEMAPGRELLGQILALLNKF